MNSSTYKQPRSLSSACRLGASLLTVLVLTIPVAVSSASPTDPFTAKATVGSSSTQAGGHPDLKVEMHKDRLNGCPGFAGSCDRDEAYIEQDLKRMTLKLEPGALADANSAPYCDAFQGFIPTEPGSKVEMLHWQCLDPGSKVGAVDLVLTLCGPMKSGAINCIGGGDPEIPGAGLHLPGAVYNERPLQGEQGRLVIFWPDYPELGYPYMYANLIKSDIGLTVRPDFGIDAVADNIPDYLTLTTKDPDGTITESPTGGQISDLVMTIDGDQGPADHPLLTAPTTCGPQSIGVDLQGWEFNSIDVPPGSTDTVPPMGNGKLLTQALSTQATGCDSLAYLPVVAVSRDTDQAGKEVSFKTTISQDDLNESATKSVKLTFPPGTGVNTNTTVTTCPAESLAANNCPESLRMGTVTAKTRFLPEDLPDPSGGIYLTGKEGSKLTISMILNTEFLNFPIRIDGTIHFDSQANTLVAEFNDVPPIQIQSFTAEITGGPGGILKNPSKCGSYSLTTDFTAHSGATHTTTSPFNVTGCVTKGPEFEVELSDKGKGKKTSVDFTVSSQEAKIKEVTFAPSRYLDIDTNGLKKKKAYGTVSVKSASGVKSSTLKKAKGKKAKSALNLVTGQSLGNLSASLYQKRYRRSKPKKFGLKRNRRKKALVKKTVPKYRLAVKGLPTDQLEEVNVLLNEGETSFIKEPRGCVSHRFLAIVKTTDGVKHYLKKRVKMGCKSAKSKRPKPRS